MDFQQGKDGTEDMKQKGQRKSRGLMDGRSCRT